MVCGFVISAHQHELLTARTRTAVGAVWRFTVTVFETLVFVLIGLSLRGVLARFGGLGAALSQVGTVTLVVVLTVIVARLLWVVGGAGLLRLRPRRGGVPPPVSVRPGDRLGGHARGGEPRRSARTAPGLPRPRYVALRNLRGNRSYRTAAEVNARPADSPAGTARWYRARRSER